MIVDRNYAFSDTQLLTGSSDVVSTNVYDAGSAIKLFGGGSSGFKISIQVTASGGTTPALSARLVGATDAALTGTPIIIASTGVTRSLVAGDIPLVLQLEPGVQLDAKQFYGIIYLQTGTNPTATVNAYGVADSQTNLLK